MLGTGEQLQKLMVTVEQLLDRSKEHFPFIFFPKDGDIVSPCSSIVLIVERRDGQSSDSLVSRVLDSFCSTTDAPDELEDVTNHGHITLSLTGSMGKDETWSILLQTAQSNLAIAKLILCQIDNFLRDPDWPKQRDDVDGAQIEALLHEAMGLSDTDSHEKRAVGFVLHLYADHRVGPGHATGDPAARGLEIDDISDHRAFISQGRQSKKHRRARDCNEASTKWFRRDWRWQGSLINLVAGVECANTANNVRGVTIGIECHGWVNGSQTFRLWDTPGLSEDSFGTVSPKQTQDALRSFLTELTRRDGVHLLVICMRRLPSRVTIGVKHAYDTIMRIRDKVNPNVPIMAIITDLEKRSSLPDILSSLDGWWADNVAALRVPNMAFPAHACITTLPDNCHPRMPGRH
ncbi:hypothetical protein EV363DRAFT_1496167 [Boletus edulis]|uniref:G domain-containing protein n=1 Tax=Boletus edulis BED1 TaxID=1328754 RepID=A0AAD4G9C7_BOLED|nr:hypothetical protein EV363DRAFT_1496167 [Boletus edulis]KAF8431191.1 hypothetical protein L210DRAFT_985991 [Boletus edulis BED1]